ncbi:MAG: integration host factor subunit alpha [Thermodesulfobacteriota bacterium]|nr:integration host factor subunit alpha [Thermodesulfobacteriota bacterium]
MTKADIVDIIYEKIGLTKKVSTKIVESTFQILKEPLERGEKVKISGFGTFLVRSKDSRRGRNPQTGGQIQISARRVITFRPSAVLKRSINNKLLS